MMSSFIESGAGAMHLPAVLLAQADSEATAKVVNFFVSGGLFMVLILLCSLVALSVVLYKAVALRRGSVIPRPLEHELLALENRVAESNTAPLGRLIAEDDSTLARVCRTALSEDHETRDAAEAAAEVTAREQVVKLQSGIAVLEVVITIAPLLGLLGTVSGLVSVFGTLGGVAEIADPAQVARGIAEALNTTIAGMAVAVPTVIAHSYFTRRVERFSVRMEVLVEMALAVLYRGAGAAPGISPDPVSPLAAEPVSIAPETPAAPAASPPLEPQR